MLAEKLLCIADMGQSRAKESSGKLSATSYTMDWISSPLISLYRMAPSATLGVCRYCCVQAVIGGGSCMSGLNVNMLCGPCSAWRKQGLFEQPIASLMHSLVHWWKSEMHDANCYFSHCTLSSLSSAGLMYLQLIQIGASLVILTYVWLMLWRWYADDAWQQPPGGCSRPLLPRLCGYISHHGHDRGLW